jgi:hypothetical protein
MHSLSYILALCLLLLARSAFAESSPAPTLDLRITPETDDAELADGPCHSNPHAVYQPGCPDQLNDHAGRYGPHLNILDQLLLLADRYKDVNLQSDIRSNAKLKFTMGLIDLYEEEAKARLELRIRF